MENEQQTIKPKKPLSLLSKVLIFNIPILIPCILILLIFVLTLGLMGLSIYLFFDLLSNIVGKLQKKKAPIKKVTKENNFDEMITFLRTK